LIAQVQEACPSWNERLALKSANTKEPHFTISLGRAYLISPERQGRTEAFDNAIKAAPGHKSGTHPYDLSLSKVQLDKAQQYLNQP